MECSNSKEKEVVIDIESGEASHGAHCKRNPVSGGKWGKISLYRLVGGILGFNRSGDGEPMVKLDGVSGGSGKYTNETMELLGDKSTGGHQSQGIVPLVEKDNKDHEKERRKAGKGKRALKPPRPPKGPSLDAADMRLLKEISKIAIKKQERLERIKALKKMKAARSPSASSSSSSSSLSSSGATISAMFVTVFFFLVLILQGLDSGTSSNLTLAEAPQPSPETTGLTPVQFYKTVMSDDGAASSFLPPKFRK